MLTSFPATQWISWLDAVPDVLYVFFYLFIVLALQVEPHRHVDRTRGSPRRRLESAGTYVFAFGLLVYFVVIPVILDQDLFFTYAPSLVLYVVLDGFIVLRTTAPTPRP